MEPRLGRRARPPDRSRTELPIADGRIARLAFTQRDPDPRRGLRWNQRIQVAVGSRAATAQPIPVQTERGARRGSGRGGLPAPLFVLPNGGGIAYGELQLDPRDSLVAARRHLPGDRRRADARSGVGHALGCRCSTPRPPDAVPGSRSRAAASSGADELNVSRILGYMGQAYWQFLPRRPSALPSRRDVERVLRQGLDARAVPEPEVGMVLGAARHRPDAADARVARARVAEDREGARAVAGRDRTSSRWRRSSRSATCRRGSEILDQQLERIEEPGSQGAVRVRQAGAVAGSDGARCVLRDRSKTSPNRRREPWVLEGLRYLHHPLRAAASEKYIPSRASTCCARSSGPATSSSRSAGRTRRSAATTRPPPPNGEGFPRARAAGLSRSAAPDRAVVSGRSRAREHVPLVENRRAGDLAGPH